nr:MAG TPA: hypothetical protein [Caudoviricetes sp.]
MSFSWLFIVVRSVTVIFRPISYLFFSPCSLFIDSIKVV